MRPFAFVYGFVMSVRNGLYDLNWLKSYKPKVFTIAVGNLNTGGSGKTPFTEFLLMAYKRSYKIAVVSRGYKRRTQGFYTVNVNSNPLDTGDEPLQIKQKFPEALVVVCEERAVAIRKIEREFPEINLIILDDAFQHRSVNAHCYILLTTYNNLFISDYILPAGRLREKRKGAERADFILITKCPSDLSLFDRNELIARLKPKAYQKVFFAKEHYGKLTDMFSGKNVDPHKDGALLISGLAYNSNFINHVKTIFEIVDVISLPDHATYNISLIERIKRRYSELLSQFISCIITTEKDAVKLREFMTEFEGIPVYVLPYEHDIYEREEFLSSLENKIKI